MKKSLEGKLIKAWRDAIRPYCDSKVSSFWRKRDLKKFCRENARILAQAQIGNRSRDIARTVVGDDWKLVSDYVYEHEPELSAMAREEIEADEFFDAAEIVAEEMDCWE